VAGQMEPEASRADVAAADHSHDLVRTSKAAALRLAFPLTRVLRRYLTVINIVLGIHGGIDGDVGGPFFYSRTPRMITNAAPAPADARIVDRHQLLRVLRHPG